ncbi:hypothetical protein ACS0TY_001939 [Phlomoides rotata]
MQSIRFVVERINATFGLNFTPHVVHMRVHTLYSRWNLFDHLLSVSGNKSTNKMYAASETWCAIMEFW